MDILINWYQFLDSNNTKFCKIDLESMKHYAKKHVFDNL